MAAKYVEFTVLLAVFLSFFFGLFLLLSKGGNKFSRKLMGIFFLTLGLSTVDIYFQVSRTYFDHPHLAFILNSLPLFYGPLFWLLTKALTTHNFEIAKKDYLHFSPFILSSLFFVAIYHIHNVDYKREFLNRVSESETTFGNIASVVVIFGIIGIYLFFSFKRIKRYRNQIRQHVSNIDKINLGWLGHLLKGFLILLLLLLLLQIMHGLAPDSSFFDYLLMIALFVTLLFIMSTIIRGLRTESVSSDNLKFQEKTRISNSETKKKFSKLMEFMKLQKPFLNPSINLSELADLTELSPRELSNIINTEAQHSFFDFINSYRIDFVKHRITNSKDEKLTILEVMYEAGFNSKSSFNTAFKKHTGVTPTQWKNGQRRK